MHKYISSRQRIPAVAALFTPGARVTAILALLLVPAFAVFAVGAPAGVAAQAPDSGDAELAPGVTEGVGVAEKLGDSVPLDLMVRDEHGDEHRLGDFLSGGKPAVLNLGYYGCPMLCGLVLNGLTDAVREMGWTPGEQFAIVSLSIDPSESPRLAMEKKRNYINSLGQAEAAAGWHFLTAEKQVSQTVADAVGFGYRYDPIKSQYVHPAVLVILMPDGRVSRYLYGIKFAPQTLRLSLVEAGEGKVGSPLDKVLLTCFQYDPARGGYRLMALGLMRMAGAMTVVAVAATIGTALLRERHRRKTAAATS